MRRPREIRLRGETNGERRAVVSRRRDGFQQIEIGATVEHTLTAEATAERAQIVRAAGGERFEAEAAHVCGGAKAELWTSSLILGVIDRGIGSVVLADSQRRLNGRGPSAGLALGERGCWNGGEKHERETYSVRHTHTTATLKKG